MRRYELETEREGSAVYFFIRDIGTLDIVLLPTKYLMHKIRSKCSPNTIRRSALSILYYLEYIHEKEQELIDIYQMPYVEQTEHFVKFLYWLKAGKHTQDENHRSPNNGTCNAYLKDVFRFYLFVRAKPCLPLWSFSLIRKTELWKTNKPPAMQVSQHYFSLQKKTSGGIINVGSPTALIYTGGIHMDNNSLSHTKWNCKYHIVFAPKYRRKVAYGKIKQDIADILSMLCKRKGVKIVEAEICPDHVHMLVEIPPSISVSYFVGYLKGKSTLMIFERHANLKYKYGNRHFWCRGYYVDTVGKNAKKIQEYIANQLQDDLEYDQMTLKEYIDPFTGEPVKRNK